MNQNQQIKENSSDNFTVYKLVRWSLVNPLFYGYFQGHIYGGEKVPLQQPLIIVSNHASVFDPPLVGSSIRRPVAFMAKEELFRVNGLKQLITLLGAYPVNRQGADRSAIKNALNSLKKGWAAGIFIEGTRTDDGKVHNPKLGAAMIAAKAKAPLLPLSLWGTEKIFSKNSSFPKPVPVTIRIGDLIEPPSSVKREALETVTNKCAEAINFLHDLGR
jgi:1-acyl-sn-glycerol-3-phosphate acyltransferase